MGVYLEMGFQDFKIKLTEDFASNSEKIAILKANLDNEVKIRFDANNCWANTDMASRQLAALDCDFWAVEEPLAAGEYMELVRLAKQLEVKIILDESFQRTEQLAEIENTIDHWVINLRVSKMGGLLRSLDLVEACRASELQVIVGAQVGETSLLTRAALVVAHSARDILVAQEGAFGTYLLDHDPCEPPVMFGRGGHLDVSSSSIRTAPGCGLRVNT